MLEPLTKSERHGKEMYAPLRVHIVQSQEGDRQTLPTVEVRHPDGLLLGDIIKGAEDIISVIGRHT